MGAIVAPAGMTAAFTNSALELVVTRLDVGPDAVRAATALLSEEERKRAGRFVFDRDRRRFTVARATLRELLASRLGMRPESVELVHGARGKPALARGFSRDDLRFNLSHCKDVAVYALTRGRDVGVDVEAVRVMPDGDDIAARFFSVRENETYRALDVRDKPLAFFNCWTRKEAFIKALGHGLHHPLDSFDVSLLAGEPGRILRVGNTSGEHCGWQLRSFVPCPGYVGAVVIEGSTRQSDFTVHMEQVGATQNELLDDVEFIRVVKGRSDRDEGRYD
jgi:4'-phosphopantetheinyl transferase